MDRPCHRPRQRAGWRVRRPGWICRRSLRDSATAEALRAMGFVSSELQAIVPPRWLRPGLTQPPRAYPRDAQEPPPFAPRNAWGAALQARVPPMHDVDKLRIVPDEGSILDAKRDWVGSRFDVGKQRGTEGRKGRAGDTSTRANQCPMSQK